MIVFVINKNVNILTYLMTLLVVVIALSNALMDLH